MLRVTAVDRSDRLRCPHAERCGGCTLSELDYGGQLAHKAESVRRAFAGYEVLAARPVDPVTPAPSMLHYRVRDKLVVEGGKVGLFARGSHEVIDIPECQLASATVGRVVAAVRRRLPFDFPVFGIDVREVDAGALLTLIVSERVDEAHVLVIARELCRDEPTISGVSLSRRAEQSPRLLGAAPKTILGTDLAPHRLAPASPYQLARAGSFVQAHPAQASALYAGVERALAARLPGGLRGKRVLELFAGSGALALRLSSLGATVTAVDSHAPGIEALARAAREQGLPLATRAERAENSVISGSEPWDAVVVDPPRRGLLPELRRAIARAAPRVLVYVSCEPRTLARDLSHFAELGYGASSLVPFDLLPLSDSVEMLCVLERGDTPAPRLLHEDERLLAVDAPAFADSLLGRVRRLPGAAGAVPLDRDAPSGVCLFARREPLGNALAQDASAEYTVLVRGITRKRGRLRGADYVRTRVVGTHSLLAVSASLGRAGGGSERHGSFRRESWTRDLARIGHPLLGEARHGDPKSNRHFLERHGLDRAFCHLRELVLSEPSVRLSSPLAPDLAAVLESLGERDEPLSRPD